LYARMIFPFRVKHNKMMAFNHIWQGLAQNYFNL